MELRYTDQWYELQRILVCSCKISLISNGPEILVLWWQQQDDQETRFHELPAEAIHPGPQIKAVRQSKTKRDLGYRQLSICSFMCWKTFMESYCSISFCYLTPQNLSYYHSNTYSTSFLHWKIKPCHTLPPIKTLETTAPLTSDTWTFNILIRK